MHTIKKYLKSSSIYFLGQMLSKIMVVLLLPLYTKKINPSGYGYYDLINTSVNIITTLIYLEIWTRCIKIYIGLHATKGKV